MPSSPPAPAPGPPVTPLARALAAADQALDAPRRAGIPLGNWRWVVRQRVAALRETLTSSSGTTRDGWLDVRGGAAFEERNRLMARLGTLAEEVLDSPDVEKTRLELKRVLVEVHRHVKRRHG